MRYFFILIIFSFVISIQAQQANENQKAFSAKMTVSSETLNIDQLLTIRVILTYPTSFHPNVNLMRLRLLTYGGIDGPPFTFVKDVISPPRENEGIMTQEIDFFLSPQVSGKHFVTFYLIEFTSTDPSQKAVQVASEIFSINIFAPSTPFNLLALIEPPMPLSQELPVLISHANKEKYLKNPLLNDQEALKNILFLKNKAFPWISLLSAFAVLLLILMIKMHPSKIEELEKRTNSKEENALEIRHELDSMELSLPKNPKEVNIFINQLDFLLRKYFVNQYQFPAFSFTAQELIKKTEGLDHFTPDIKKEIIAIFKKADQIKYAHDSGNPDETKMLLQSAKDAINLSIKQ